MREGGELEQMHAAARSTALPEALQHEYSTSISMS